MSGITIQETLKQYGQETDTGIPLVETALCLALDKHQGRGLGPYQAHIKKLSDQVRERFDDLVGAGAEDTPETRLAAIKHIMCDLHGYVGDQEQYNDLRNADLIEVIDRRKGLPIALSIIAIAIGRAQGWDIDGLNFPGHFLIRMDLGGKRIIADPFNGFRMMHAPDLRQLLKSVAGENAELSAGLYQETTNREILLRLQNNIKFRLIEGEEYAEALRVVSMMRLFAPLEYRLLLDESILNARLGNTEKAIDVIRDYLEVVPDPKDRYDAELLLRTLEITLGS